MRMLTAASALVFAACSLGRASAATTATFSDAICPEATQYVIGVGKLTKDDSPQRIYDAAQAAVDAYQRCSKDKLANGFREAQHYADVRGAGFAVVAARALVALSRQDDAKRELLQWRPLVQQVVDWQAETQTYAQGHAGHDPTDETLKPMIQSVSAPTGGNDKRASMYRQSAKDIVAAIDAELTKLGASPVKT